MKKERKKAFHCASSISIRQPRGEDLPALKKLVMRFAGHHGTQLPAGYDFKSLLPLLSSFWCAFDHKGMIGFVLTAQTFSLFQGKPVIFMNGIYVTDAYRKSTAALRLVRAVTTHARKIDAAWIDWVVARDNPYRQKFTKTGARENGEWVYQSIPMRELRV